MSVTGVVTPVIERVGAVIAVIDPVIPVTTPVIPLTSSYDSDDRNDSN